MVDEEDGRGGGCGEGGDGWTRVLASARDNVVLKGVIMPWRRGAEWRVCR